MNIILAADHAGLELKDDLSGWLETSGYRVEDLGVFDSDPSDYPLLAEQAARVVAGDPDLRGILICGSGNGMAVVANKIPGIRAINAHSSSEVQAARKEGDINIIALGGQNMILEEAKSIVEDFLQTEFTGDQRQHRRLQQIATIESRITES